jgi:very-short-patch-repair endonuclease
VPGEGKVRRVTAELRDLARVKRRQMTASEARLWNALRGGKIEGHRFRRQHAVATFVLDFYCPSARLVIEVDGGIHDAPDVAEHDELRQSVLENQGLRVLRIRNEEISDDLASVVERITTVIIERTRHEERGSGAVCDGLSIGTETII